MENTLPKQLSTEKRAWRIVRRSAAGLALLIAVLCISGALYNALSLRHLRNAWPPPGQFASVDGHRMHLYCIGSGEPTVVLESGGAESYLVWGKVQPALSHITRVCSYDRAGLGWSKSEPGSRDAVHVAEQLHGLLTQAGIGGPLVLMGHSAGGLYIRTYAARFPANVAALVFVDATSPSEFHKLPASVAALDHHSATQMAVFQTMIALGIPRLLGQCETPPPGFEATTNLWRADACKPAYVTAVRREMAAMPQSMAQTAQATSFGDLPILVVSRDTQLPRPAHLPAPVSASDWLQGNAVHDAAQQALMELSTRSRRVIAKGSGHYIHFDRPQLLVRDVSALLQRIRNGNAEPGNKTTITE